MRLLSSIEEDVTREKPADSAGDQRVHRLEDVVAHCHSIRTPLKSSFGRYQLHADSVWEQRN